MLSVALFLEKGAKTASSGTGTLNGLLNFAVSTVAIIIVLALVIFIIKDVIGFLKGQGSIFPILAKVGAAILIIALIFLAKGFSDRGEELSNEDGAASKIMDSVTDDVNSINFSE